MSAPTHHLVVNDPHIYLSPDAFIIMAALLWSLFGLWMYLNARRFGENGFFITMMCGPSAWIAAIWFALNRPVKRQRVKALIPVKHWETPIDERWKN
jgi:hypothetical protein